MRALAVCGFALGLLSACSSKKPLEEDVDAAIGDDGSVITNDGAADTGLPACASGQYEATQAPTALLVLLQRSGSMAQNNKWVFAAQAIVQALDQPVFDTMSVGLISAPTTKVQGPACIFNLPVACGVPPFPQVDLKPAGKNKSSDPTGPRHDIKTWLSNNAPDMSLGEGNPLYSAIQAALGALQAYSISKRILFVITDGGVSCTSLSNRPGYMDGNMCPDWENPNNLIQLVQKANTDPNAPVETFIVGVPGSDTYDPSGTNYPPYHMRAALSSIAKAGSPKYVPANCTGNIPFNQNDPDPQTSCHFDMTQNYTAKAVADAIAQVRGAVLGCIFDLPKPDGGMIDPNKVNVSYSLGGNPIDLYKRKDPSNMCLLDGCWDYTSNQTQVELIGKACQDIKTATSAKVSITVGCATNVR
jgi:hypothetical protein